MGAAVVVLRVRDGFVLHELVATRRPHHCDIVSGMRLVTRPMSIDELESLTRDPRVEFSRQLEAFVGGTRVIDRADLESAPATPTFRRTC